MQLTVTVPDRLSYEKLAECMREIEHVCRKKGIACEIHQEPPQQSDA